MIRKSEYGDIPAIMVIINSAKEYLASQSINQWQNGYPNEEVLKEDIENSCGYVLTLAGEVKGYCSIRQTVDPCYGVIEHGEWKNDRPYIVLHRTCIAPECKGGGSAGIFVRFAEEMAEKLGIKDLRADTHARNRSMRRMLEKNGFAECGIVYMADGAERIAFQKVLDETMQQPLV